LFTDNFLKNGNDQKETNIGMKRFANGVVKPFIEGVQKILFTNRRRACGLRALM
jgi:hypothetical protein